MNDAVADRPGLGGADAAPAAKTLDPARIAVVVPAWNEHGKIGDVVRKVPRSLASTVIVLATFVVTTLVEEPATAVTLCVILAMSVALDFGWKRRRNGKSPSSPTHAAFQQVEETS